MDDGLLVASDECRDGHDETRNALLDDKPATLIVPVEEAKGYLLIKSLLCSFRHRVRVFSIVHDLFDGHKRSTRRERVGAASRWDILRIRRWERGSDRRRNRNCFRSRRSRRDRTDRSNFYTWSMKLRGILRGGGDGRKTRRTNCRDRRVATIGTMAQSILHVVETNSQRSILGLQLLILFFERVMILSQLVNVEPMAI